MDVQPYLIAALFFLSYLAVVFVWPSVRTYRQTGIHPVTFGPTDNVHDFIGRGFKVLIAFIALTIAASWSRRLLLPCLLPVWFLKATALKWAGTALCLTAFVWTVIAQHQMGQAWRIGIDKKHKTALQTGGLFSVSRNPVFLGLLTALLGLFLLLPNALTLVCLIAGYILVQVAIRLEEEHLLQQHGTVYHSYKARVRRLL